MAKLVISTRSNSVSKLTAKNANSQSLFQRAQITHWFFWLLKKNQQTYLRMMKLCKTQKWSTSSQNSNNQKEQNKNKKDQSMFSFGAISFPDGYVANIIMFEAVLFFKLNPQSSVILHLNVTCFLLFQEVFLGLCLLLLDSHLLYFLMLCDSPRLVGNLSSLKLSY